MAVKNRWGQFKQHRDHRTRGRLLPQSPWGSGARAVQAAASPPNSVAVTVNTLQRQHKQQRAHRARGQRKQRSHRLNGSEG